MSNLPALNLPATLALNAELSKDDLTAITVNQYEERLLAEDRRLQAETTRVTTEIQRYQDAYNKALAQAGESVVEKRAAALRTALNAFKNSPKTIKATTEIAANRLKVTVMLTHGDNVYHGAVIATETHKVPTALHKQQQQIEEAKRELAKIQQDRVEIRSSLAQVNRMERKARASLAKIVLQQSAQGRAMLEQLEDVQPLPGMVSIEVKSIKK